jgi:hypothetical protein
MYGTGAQHLKRSYAVGKTKVTCFPTYVEDRANTNTSITIYTYKNIQNLFPKSGAVRGAKGGGKEEKNDGH